MLPNLSPFIRNRAHHHSLNRQQYEKGGLENTSFCNQEKNTGKGEFHYSIVLFRAAQNIPSATVEKNI